MNSQHPWKQVTWTLVLLAVLHSMRYIPLPILTEGVGELTDEIFGLGRFGILALGIAPFVSAFVFVELYSLLTPWGRRVRHQGSEGRRQLNKWAMGVGLLVCGVQTLSMMIFMETVTTPGGLALVPNPGWMTRLIALVTLTAASTAAFMLCNAVTVWGLGNGFCLLLVVDFLLALAEQRADLASALDSTGPAIGPAAYLIALTIVAATVGSLLKKPASYPATGPDEEALRMPLPAFPQCLVPVSWAYVLLNLPGTLSGFTLSGLQYVAGMTVLVPLLSFLTLHFFSSRDRVESNLPRVELPSAFEPVLNRHFWITTAVLTAMATGFTALELYVLTELSLPSLVPIVMVTAVAMDLASEWRFRTLHPDAEPLVELDEVHFALYLEKLLAARGVACLIRAYHLRSLLFFFGPIYKMNVLVPADRLEQARETLADLDPAVAPFN